jgi:hypothetical protein
MNLLATNKCTLILLTYFNFNIFHQFVSVNIQAIFTVKCQIQENSASYLFQNQSTMLKVIYIHTYTYIYIYIHTQIYIDLKIYC